MTISFGEQLTIVGMILMPLPKYKIKKEVRKKKFDKIGKPLIYH